uniref:Uncharacterized protein n=1 Tax=Aegilops tauschii subsp. strangulata TaxID=200361 RepID=A0A453LQ51_AEGTS
KEQYTLGPVQIFGLCSLTVGSVQVLGLCDSGASLNIYAVQMNHLPYLMLTDINSYVIPCLMVLCSANFYSNFVQMTTEISHSKFFAGNKAVCGLLGQKHGSGC